MAVPHSLMLQANLPLKSCFAIRAFDFSLIVYTYVSTLFLLHARYFQDGFGVRMKHRLHLLVGAFWTLCFSGLHGDLRIGLARLGGGRYKENGWKRKIIYTTQHGQQNLNTLLYGGRSSFNADGSGYTM